MPAHYSGNAPFPGHLRASRSVRVALTIVRPLSKLRALFSAAGNPRGARAQESILANTKSAEKAARQAVVRRERNVIMRSRLRTALRDVTQAIASGKKDAAESAYRSAMPVIDSMVTKGIIHKNKASRHKSRLAQGIRGMK